MKESTTNFGLALVGAPILVLIYQPSSWVGLLIIAALSFPYKHQNNLYAFWGGVASGDVTSIFALYQKAGGNALAFSGVCFYQKAEREAYQGICINLFQEANVAIQGICLSYSQVGKSVACRILGYGAKQSAPLIQNRLTIENKDH